MNLDSMSTHEKDLLLMALMYRVTPDIRRKVMQEVPGAYNAYFGREIVQVLPSSE